MMKIHRYPSRAAERKLNAIARRSLSFRQKDTREVARIIARVQKDGDAALVEYTRRFDAPGFKTAQIAVPPAEIKQAVRQVDRRFKRALNRAIRQIEGFHRQQFRKSWIDTPREGVLLGQLFRPVDSAGIYVPGGQGGSTPLVSSVLMGALPARIAGVPRLVMTTPPTRDGKVNPHLLAAAQAVGIDTVYRVGSAWAIAALAHGTTTIDPVDVIVGPGNLYVTLAKKLVAGTVGIDMLAGPSEILIVADQTADPEYAAADMLSQAEHDVLSSAVLLTDSAPLARETAAALEKQLAALTRREIAAASLERFGAIIQVDDINTAITLANRIAPEHLELLTRTGPRRTGRCRPWAARGWGRRCSRPPVRGSAPPKRRPPRCGSARPDPSASG